LPRGAAKEGFEADEKYIEVKRLSKIVVGSRFDPFENVFGARASGEHKDRGIALGLAEGADDGEAVGAGEHAIENHGSDVLLRIEKVSERCVTVGLLMGTIAFGLKVKEEALSKVLFIFDDDDKGNGGFSHETLGSFISMLFVTISVAYIYFCSKGLSSSLMPFHAI
jgi:hypothetical protein